jgi:protein-disulfide isomerase
MKKTIKSGFITVPAAIIIGAAIIAIAIIIVLKPASKSASTGTNTDKTPTKADTVSNINMRPVTSADHILGNPNAPIKIVEYSDTECPYCRIFAPTIEKIVSDYGPSGDVAWVYRSYPLSEIHKNSIHEAEAMECAASLGGNEKYWTFLKRIYEVTPSVTSQSPDGLDQGQLPVIAKFAGLDVKAFNTCLSGDSMKSKVLADVADGTNAGVNGTPFNIFVLSKPAPESFDQTIIDITLQWRLPSGLLYMSSDRTKVAMSGALPYELFKKILDSLLGK